MPQRDQIFISYSHADDEYLQRLRVHLRPFERENVLKIWSDKKIQASQQWQKEIQKALQQTAVAILLVSADFLASDFIASEELPRLLNAAESKEVSILSFILKPCLFAESSLSKYQAVNDPAQSLILLDEAQKEQKWVELARTAKVALDKFKAQHKADVDAKQDATVPKNKKSRKTLKWNKVATLFWLGNDLMWIQDQMYRGAAPQRVLQGVDNAVGYAREIGFTDDTYPVERLEVAKQELHRIGNIPTAVEGYPTILQSHYDAVRREIEAVKWYIHELAGKEQADFVKRRAL